MFACADEASSWKTTAGENTGGKGTVENPMTFDEAKTFDADGKYAYDRYSDNIPKCVLIFVKYFVNIST